MEAEVIARSGRPPTVAGLVPQPRAAGAPAVVEALTAAPGPAGTPVPLVDPATGSFRSHRR